MSGRTIETSIDIAAPVDRVWHVLTGFASFPQWSRFILSIEGEARAGTRLSVCLDDGGGATQIRPEVLICKEPVELRWRGVVGANFLLSAEHWFRLQALPGGGTRLTHGEVFGGFLVPLFWARLNTCTRRGFQDFNAALRERAEHNTGREKT
jgi:hypothetical protein